MDFSALSLALGGLGLLLLGMSLMTEGLKAAAGDALLRVLEQATRTRARAALAGFALTAVVQSSSAVIVATLGFINAGLLRLRQAAWIVFGSNVGTTMTAWIVALVGLRIKVEIVALPMIGAGMLLQLLRSGTRSAHVGQCIVGFGVLFMGLGLLRDAFVNAPQWIPVEQLAASGPLSILLGVLFGALLTGLIQSSSAALAIVLTASTSGVLAPMLAASMVIGANIGTTVTSALASIGATTNAKRLALVHVCEKVITAIVALALLLPLWWLSSTLIPAAERGNISASLAMFHTLFNLLGLALMALLADHLLRSVERLIKRPELVSSQPRYLDETALSVPATGLAAMHSELKRVFKQLLSRSRRLIDPQTPPPDEDLHTEPLLAAIAQFGARLGAQALSQDAAEHYLNLNRAREELSGLREQLRALQHVPEPLLAEAISNGMRKSLLALTLSGELKQLDAGRRDKLRRKVRRLRRKQRRELLAQIRPGQLTAEAASQQLWVASTLETAARHILDIADALYPPAESSADAEATPVTDSAA